MPISNIPLSSPEPDDQIPGQTSFETTSQEKPAKRGRRTKKQMIEDAVIPNNDAIIDLKDAGTGAKIERPWSEAIQLVAAEKASFVDASLKYAVMKMAEQGTSAPTPSLEEQAAHPETVERETRYTIDGKALLKTGSEGAAGGDRLIHYSDSNGGLGEMFEAEWELLSMSPPPRRGPVATSNVPPEAEIGDEVLVGAETLRIGHNKTLTSYSVAVDGEIIQPKRRWQRELGGGVNGKWESSVINADGGVQTKKVKQAEQPAMVDTSEFEEPRPIPTPQNGHGDADKVAPVNTEEAIRAQGGEVEWVDEKVIKIGTGTLDKIGLPNYSSIQVGPVTLSRSILDDGRRQVVDLPDGRQGEVISAAVEGFELLNNTVEFVAARFRGELQAFLAATGALNQPVA